MNAPEPDSAAPILTLSLLDRALVVNGTAAFIAIDLARSLLLVRAPQMDKLAATTRLTARHTLIGEIDMRTMTFRNACKVMAYATMLMATTMAAAAQAQAQPQTPGTPRTTPGTAGQPDRPKDAGAMAKGAKPADASFVMQAAEGGMMEVTKGKIAAQKAANGEVKQFGQRMVDDHTKANDELKSLASSKNITLPGETPKPPMQAAIAKLEKLSGAAFDRAYVEDQVRDHEKTIALFEREAKTGKDAELKAFAEKTLPTLKEHLTAVRELRTKVMKGES